MHSLATASFGALALFVTACSASEAASTSGDDTSVGGTGGSAGAGLALYFTGFAGDSSLMLGPGAMRTLEVTASPAEPPQTIRFALVDGPGSVEVPGWVADAVLDKTEETTVGGVATVTLTAPSVPTMFDLRALAGDALAKLPVEVARSGHETLVVHPSYAGGRHVVDWTAEVYEELTCTDLDGNPPEGSVPPMPTVSVARGERIAMSVPVGPGLAVVVRAGHFAGGCSFVDSVVEGESNSVVVTVTNRPIQLDESHTTIALGLTGQDAELAAAMEPVVDAACAAALGPADDDTEALLDAMQDEADAGGTCDSFETARAASAWDDRVREALGADAASGIRDDLGVWLRAGIPSFARDDAFVGTLSAAPGVVDHALLTLTSVAGFRPSDAGFAGGFDATWTADAGDNVVIGTTLSFNPTALLALGARAPARVAVPAATTLAGALALHGARCATVASTLTENGQGPGQSCSDCNVDCTLRLCERALSALVLRASGALAADPAELRVAASGSGKVGEQAELQTLDGSWLGALVAANASSELGGVLSAEGAY